MKKTVKFNVVYERHYADELHRISRFESRSRLAAWLVYHWYDCFYVLSILPVKYLARYRTNGSLIIKRSMKCKSQGRDLLLQLKRRTK